jgi:CRISPR-associated protein Cas2
MAELRHEYLVCYDIRCPKRWRRAFKLLKGYGGSVQLSIFRCRLSQRDREKLRWELSQILKPEDSILLVGLCHRCCERVPQYNNEGAWEEAQPSFRIL